MAPGAKTRTAPLLIIGYAQFLPLSFPLEDRDLFDLATALGDSAAGPDRVAEAFIQYMARSGHPVTRALFEQNLAGKLCGPHSAPI